MAACFFRLVLVSPGYVPRPKDDPEKALTTPDPTTAADMFLCEVGGYPRWCRHCQIVKPDRAHHSKDCGRCTYKMGATTNLSLLMGRPLLSLGRWDGGVYEVQVFSAVCHVYRHILCICRAFSGTCPWPLLRLLMGSCWRDGYERIVVAHPVHGS